MRQLLTAIVFLAVIITPAILASQVSGVRWRKRGDDDDDDDDG